MSDAETDKRLLDAHGAGDGARMALIYAEAADRAEAAGATDRACFFLTQAWIFALEAGDPMADEFRARLVAQGRETQT